MPKKILLIEPPFRRLYKESFSLVKYPLSLGYLAAAIKSNTDWDVCIYNADFSPKMETERLGEMDEGFTQYLHSLKDLNGSVWAEVEHAVRQYNPSVVGITAMSPNYHSACIVAKIVKKINNNIKVVLGGAHPSCSGSEVLDCPDIDISVRGEGEITIIELINAIYKQTGLEGIRGISYRKQGQICENANREFIKNLDSVSFPYSIADSVLMDYDKYPKRVFNRIFSTRGCPFNCYFCSSKNIWSRQVRFRSIDNIIDEIRNIREKFNIDYVHFDDDTFGINKQFLQDLCSAMGNNLPGLKWSCELHVSLVDDKVVRAMKESGCIMIQVGIESGNNEVLKKINKNITVEKAIEACRIIKKSGIELQAFFMIGFPWETAGSLADTKLAMQKSKADIIHYSIFTPYPGTEMFDICKQYNLIDNSYDVSLYNHQSPENHFCIEIPKTEFRRLALSLEKFVDRINSRYRIKRLMTYSTFKRIKELGIKKSLNKGLKILKYV